ncbi:hypothetical protein C366_02371 [Cryptococcus neoformans Tu401-1]|nr:hypothetical protein C365_02515 [Cryptococcus neoformans var. grubii Bt85]OXG19518.1 hypothetical protein C366_02371 [Cryptococcus neoformans var. grubii Tu401-1]OXM80026.1 hypothetical protein C364_02332 [Cryptococcus neoformans var. grubii Bt63]
MVLWNKWASWPASSAEESGLYPIVLPLLWSPLQFPLSREIAIPRQRHLCQSFLISRRTCFNRTSSFFILKWFSSNAQRPTARRLSNIGDGNLFGAFRGWIITSKSSAFNIFTQSMRSIRHL